MRSGYPKIADYALIGDCHGSALVCRDGSIDWACIERFDCGAIFCRLLDARDGGMFAIEVADLQRTDRAYVDETNVLKTTFVTSRGEMCVYDLFAMTAGGRTDPYRQLLRVFEGVSGEVDVAVTINPRFDYASLHPWLDHDKTRDVHTAVGGDDAIVLSTDVSLTTHRRTVGWTGRFRLSAGERRRFSIVSCEPHETPNIPKSSPREIDDRLRETLTWWQAWLAKGKYPSEHRDVVVRSALVLKLLTCAPTGAVIAAPTTSLPETIGGERNWDYRYSWVRDASMTIAALFAVGHAEVASGFHRFIMRAAAGSADELQIMYGCYGERRLTEVELPHLDGYRGSRPVRIGNGAKDQVQLDIYGELLGAARLGTEVGDPIDAATWRFLRSVVAIVAERWNAPDQGLWETRGAPQHFVYSKAMCWLTLDHAITIAERDGLSGDIDFWKRTRDEIRHDIDTKGVDPARGCFVQAYGSTELDASLLRLPIIGFVDARDPRMLATVAAIRETLAHGPLLSRYRPQHSDDGIGTHEGAFLLVSFWLVEVLAMQGEIAEAEALFAELIGLRNDVDLFAEEYDAQAKEMLGNFPQAFTHIALINAVERLSRAKEQGGESRREDDIAVESATNK